MRTLLICFMGLVLLLIGCSQEVSYKLSAIHLDFPIPENAKLTDGKAENPNLEKYVKYKWKDADEIGSIPSSYLKVIKQNGWKERKEEQLGAVRFFEKDGTVVVVTTNDGFFNLAILNQKTK
jgi:hypothetical protein